MRRRVQSARNLIEKKMDRILWEEEQERDRKRDPTPAQIQAWVRRTTLTSNGGPPVFRGWDKKLWAKPRDDIVEYLIGRFKTTLSEVEYYFCMLYLDKDMEKELLYVPSRQSPQYQKMLEGEIGDRKVATPPATIKEGVVSVKQGVFSINIKGVNRTCLMKLQFCQPPE